MDPVDFPVAPAKAVPLALARAGIKMEEVAVWEFNEAFAVVIKANEKVGLKYSLDLGVLGFSCLCNFGGCRCRDTANAVY